jgi:hypothetical protein
MLKCVLIVELLDHEKYYALSFRKIWVGFHEMIHRKRVIRKVIITHVGKSVCGHDSSRLGFSPPGDGEICLGPLDILKSPNHLCRRCLM